MAWTMESDVRGAAGRFALRMRPLLRFGLLGGALAYALSLRYPQLFDGRLSLPLAVYLGSMAGACVSDAAQGLLRPWARSIAYYVNILELELQLRGGRMKPRTFDRIKGELDERYFLRRDGGRLSTDAEPPCGGR